MATSACISCISSCSGTAWQLHGAMLQKLGMSRSQFASPCLLGCQRGHLLSAISAAKNTNKLVDNGTGRALLCTVASLCGIVLHMALARKICQTRRQRGSQDIHLSMPWL